MNDVINFGGTKTSFLLSYSFLEIFDPIGLVRYKFPESDSCLTEVIFCWVSCNWVLDMNRTRHEICQTFYTTGFSGRKFYTLKVHALRLFLLTIKQCKCIDLGPFLFNYTKCVKIKRFKGKISLGVYKFWTSTQIMQEKTLFS